MGPGISVLELSRNPADQWLYPSIAAHCVGFSYIPEPHFPILMNKRSVYLNADFPLPRLSHGLHEVCLVSLLVSILRIVNSFKVPEDQRN